jgi:hypothetical protein
MYEERTKRIYEREATSAPDLQIQYTLVSLAQSLDEINEKIEKLQRRIFPLDFE